MGRDKKEHINSLRKEIRRLNSLLFRLKKRVRYINTKLSKDIKKILHSEGYWDG